MAIFITIICYVVYVCRAGIDYFTLYIMFLDEKVRSQVFTIL